MSTFNEVFAKRAAAPTYAPSKMPKIIGVGLAVTLLLVAVGKPIDSFVEWREEVAAEEKAAEAQKAAEAEAQKAMAEQEAREAREREGLIAKNREMVGERVQRAEDQRQIALQPYRNVVEQSAEQSIQGEAARAALEQLPLPESLSSEKVTFSPDTDEDLLAGRAPNAMAAISVFQQETQQAYNYASQLKRLQNQLAFEKQRDARKAEAEAQRIAREEEIRAAREARAATRQQPQQQRQQQQNRTDRSAVTNW